MWEDAEVHESRKMSTLIYSQCSGRKGWEDAEVHESRKMSSLIFSMFRTEGMGGRGGARDPGRCPPSYILNVQDGRDGRTRRCTSPGRCHPSYHQCSGRKGMGGRGGARAPEDVLPHYPQCSGRKKKRWDNAEVHESRKMSSLISSMFRTEGMGGRGGA